MRALVPASTNVQEIFRGRLDDLTANVIGRDVLSKEELRSYSLGKSSALFDWYEISIFGMHVEYPIWLETLVVSLGFIALMLFFACWRFVRMDS